MSGFTGLDTLNVQTKNRNKGLENQEGVEDVNFFWINAFLFDWIFISDLLAVGILTTKSFGIKPSLNLSTRDYPHI